MGEFGRVNQSVPRKDAWGKVTGQAQFTDDIFPDGMLFGLILRSPHHHARITRLDVEAACAMEGVVSVLTSDNIPGDKRIGPFVQDQPVLAMDVVRHIGEPIAMIFTEAKIVAEQGLRAIRVEYEVLPEVLDTFAALASGSQKIHPDGNLLHVAELIRGDIEEGFASADVIMEEQFQLPRISPAYIEPESAVAKWNEDGTLTVWVSSQGPFEDRRVISQVLAMSEDRIHVKTPAIGGAFGGKEDPGLHVLAALGALATKRPVRLVNTREESIQAHPKRHAGTVSVKLGAKADGRLIALHVNADFDTGAYASYGPSVGDVFTEMAPGPYRTPHIKIRARMIYTNGPIGGAMRGFGTPQAVFPLESMMDILAARLEIDPIELRRKNVWRKDEHTPTGVLLLDAPSLQACLDEAKAATVDLRKYKPSEGTVSGVGMALLVQGQGLGYRVPDNTTNRIEWLPNGRVRLHLGTPDIGQGTITVGAQMAAEALGLSYEDIDVAELDTSSSPNGGVSCASRMTYMVGNASILASKEAIKALLLQASEDLNKPREELIYRSGKVYVGSDDMEGITAAEFASRAAEDGLVLRGEATYSFPYLAEVTPQDLPVGLPHVMFGFGAHVARVEIDPELATVRVTDYVAIHDVGRTINPAGVEGQIEGGVVMGIGYALLEEVRFKEDGSWTDNFGEYLIPTTLDVPRIRCVILEHPEKSGPFGARGIAEMGLPPVAPAITNAIANALSVRVTTIPVDPASLLKGRLSGLR